MAAVTDSKAKTDARRQKNIARANKMKGFGKNTFVAASVVISGFLLFGGVCGAFELLFGMDSGNLGRQITDLLWIIICFVVPWLLWKLNHKLNKAK